MFTAIVLLSSIEVGPECSTVGPYLLSFPQSYIVVTAAMGNCHPKICSSLLGTINCLASTTFGCTPSCAKTVGSSPTVDGCHSRIFPPKKDTWHGHEALASYYIYTYIYQPVFLYATRDILYLFCIPTWLFQRFQLPSVFASSSPPLVPWWWRQHRRSFLGLSICVRHWLLPCRWYCVRHHFRPSSTFKRHKMWANIRYYRILVWHPTALYGLRMVFWNNPRRCGSRIWWVCFWVCIIWKVLSDSHRNRLPRYRDR